MNIYCSNRQQTAQTHPRWSVYPYEAIRPKLVQANPGLSPYTLRHGYAYRGALACIPLRQLAASMGHDVRTHMKHYGQWTDEAGLDAAFGEANAKLTASLTKRQAADAAKALVNAQAATKRG